MFNISWCQLAVCEVRYLSRLCQYRDILMFFKTFNSITFKKDENTGWVYWRRQEECENIGHLCCMPSSSSPIVPLTNLIVHKIGFHRQEWGVGGMSKEQRRPQQTLFMLLPRPQSMVLNWWNTQIQQIQKYKSWRLLFIFPDCGLISVLTLPKAQRTQDWLSNLELSH